MQRISCWLASGLSAVLISGLFSLSLPASAQVLPGPTSVNMQGRLTGANGTALPDGAYTITVSLWDAATGGTQKFSQTLSNVPVASGLFSAQLATLTPGVLSGSLWVQMQVDADAAMTPRQPLSSVISALVANSVPDGAIGSAQLAFANASLAKVSGGSMSSVGGNVGISTTNPGAQLHVNMAGGPSVGVFAGDLAPFGSAPFETNLSGPSTHAWYAENGDRVYSITGGGQGYFLGSVGIGTAAPLQALDVNGRMNIANGVIQRGGVPITTTSDLGLYSQVDGNFVRFVTTNAPFQFYSDGGIGTNPVLSIAANGNVAAAGNLSAPSASIPTLNGNVSVAGEMIARVVTILGGSDVAEPYDVASAGDVKPLPGMVVALDADHIGRMRVASSAYDRSVAGILSGANGIAPGITLRQVGTIADGALPVASIGRVWCYADADANGAIGVGDMLTSSDTPGHAMKATDRERRDGAVIGKAMSPLPSGRGLVLVLVSLK